LLKEGFGSWNKRDFFKFIQMAEYYGRDDFERYGELIQFGKTIDEIKAYAKVYWERYKEVKNW